MQNIILKGRKDLRFGVMSEQLTDKRFQCAIEFGTKFQKHESFRTIDS